MHDETKDLTETLVWAVSMITKSTAENRQRIASAYQEAQELVAGIPKENGSARPRILACFQRSDAYRATDDVACIGWTLAAIQERVNEGDLADWRKLRNVINQLVKMLPIDPPTVH
jgi:hypothetical protein